MNFRQIIVLLVSLAAYLRGIEAVLLRALSVGRNENLDGNPVASAIRAMTGAQGTSQDNWARMRSQLSNMLKEWEDTMNDLDVSLEEEQIEGARAARANFSSFIRRLLEDGPTQGGGLENDQANTLESQQHVTSANKTQTATDKTQHSADKTQTQAEISSNKTAEKDAATDRFTTFRGRRSAEDLKAAAKSDAVSLKANDDAATATDPYTEFMDSFMNFVEGMNTEFDPAYFDILNEWFGEAARAFRGGH